MSDLRRYTVIPPEQAVRELTELLAATENKYRLALTVVNAAIRERDTREAWLDDDDSTAVSETDEAYQAAINARIRALAEWEAAQ